MDNIEVNEGTDVSLIAQIYKDALSEIIDKHNLDIDAIHVGVGYVQAGILDNLPEAKVRPSTPQKGVYTDAASQKVLWSRGEAHD